MRRSALVDALTVAMLSVMLGMSNGALAQGRDPAARQTLVNLAYVLGEAHALRQVCEGARDQVWRTRMMRLLATEQPDETLSRRLQDAFNTGFAARQGAYLTCNPAARVATARVMARGRRLAIRLARPTSVKSETSRK
ncbi:MAG: TIGR02301 family protein [Phenylobacterium zucineum]|nr:MAG: TIGR02301 family protein [Phenylobacterium zucineum]